MLKKVCPPILLLALLTLAIPILGAPLEVLQPNETTYSTVELGVLLPALDRLSEVLSDYSLGSYRYFSPNEWESLNFSAYSAGTLAALGYKTQLVARAGWPDGAHTWVLVGLPLAERTAWIPVEASPKPGKSQPTLGYIPSYTDEMGRLWFDASYLDFSQQVELPANLPPVATIRAVPSTCTLGQEATFMAVTSYDPDGEIVRFRWDLGDGRTSTSRVVHHAFTATGTYSVSLTVIDSRGASATTSLAFRVVEPSEPHDSSGGGCGCGK